MKYALSALLIAACVCTAAARGPNSGVDYQPSDIGSRVSDIDRLFAPYAAPGSPGCAVGVYRNGAIEFQKGYGLASIEHNAPITPATPFYAGSVSKQFTAMAAALAIRQSALAYEDPIRKYLPELPVYANAITVRHLIHHTSGLRDYNTLLAIAGRRDEDAWDNRAVLRITARQTALNFEPGSEYLYSNTGYTLLATIVERATKTPFAAYADAWIFKPLGMSATHYHTDARRLVAGRALAYGGSPERWTLNTPINERAGAGGVYTNLIDLQKWDENFYSATVGGATVIEQVQTPGTLNDGKALTYAWGLTIGDYRGLPIVEHSGALGGYRAHLLRFPRQHASMALLCNEGSINTSAFARRLADLVLGNGMREPVPAPPPGVVGSILGGVPDEASDARLPDYVGSYYSAEVDAIFTISVPSGLRMPALQRETDPAPVPMTMGGRDEFRVRGQVVRFQRDASNRVVSLTVDAGRVRGIAFVRR